MRLHSDRAYENEMTLTGGGSIGARAVEGRGVFTRTFKYVEASYTIKNTPWV